MSSIRFPDNTWMRLTIAVVTGIVVSACFREIPAPTVPPPQTTFQRILARAESGDAASQNIVGYMLFTGQGTRSDRSAAIRWFSTSAHGGSVVAQLNLAILHYLGAGVPGDRVEARRLFLDAANDPARPPRLRLASIEALVDESCSAPPEADHVGKDTFLTFCSGCHGVNGMAAFSLAPSFALAERMEKESHDLLSTISHGHGAMPSWGDKLPSHLLEGALRYARSLEREFRWGILHVVDEPPTRYFIFGPMSTEFGGGPTVPPSSDAGGAPTLREFCSGV